MRQTMWAALAAGAVLAGGGVSWANDTVRLGGPSAESSMQGDTDTELARWGRGGYYGGYRGGYYGRGYYGASFYGRGYGASFYGRGYYGGGHYGRGYYGGGFYGRAYYQPYYSYYPTYYSQPYYYNSYYYYPCAGETVIAPTYTILNYQAAPQQQQQQQYVPPMPPASTQNSAPYQYDGGPTAPVPMPAPEANPIRRPGSIIPLDGRLVSLPTGISGGTSQAGVPARPTSSKTNTVPRVTYPAYGEEPVPFAPRNR